MKHHLLHLIAGTVFAITAMPSWSGESDTTIGSFEITRFAVEGNTLLPGAAVEALLAPYTGTGRHFGDVQRALETLEAAYRQRGFSVVQVVLPEQELNQGVVHFKVVEARVGKVIVEGNKFFDEANIRRSLPGLQEGSTPNIGRISNSLRIANENPAKKTTLQLQSGEKDGEVNAAIKVADEKTWRIGATLDNTGDKNSGTSHLGILYQNANLWGLDHVLSLQYTTAVENPSRVSVYGAGYHIPLYALGDSMDLFASYSDVDAGSVSAGIFDLQVSGKGSIAGFRYNQNFKRLGNYESKLIYGLDYKAYKNNVTLTGIQLGSDVTVHPLSLSYTGAWDSAGGESGFYFTGLHNLPGGERGRSEDFNRVREGAPAGYNILRYGINFSRILPKDWQMRLNLNGQYTRDALVSGEQFGAGGANSVRGFQERDIANDTGHAVNAELYTPNLCGRVGAGSAQCRVLAFYDGAQVSRNHSLPGEQSQASIGSVGVGFRMAVDRYVNLQMDYGRVVDAGGSQSKGDKRLHFRLGLSY